MNGVFPHVAGGVVVKCVAGLGEHGLAGAVFGVGPAEGGAECTEVGEVEERGVGDDEVVGAADPADGRFGVDPVQVVDTEVGGSHGVEDTSGTGAVPR
ncbi:hypothetical protein ACFXPY_46020 [Streptomyces sp. NPDC059153]|uniref:hypothetical protein n=1 Tax=Streptomyces sp. NPDC059153 TaxID=3346743 RepID=UPI0036B8EA45